MIPAHVLSAFGVSGPPSRLPGGQGESWRVGDAVFKQAGREDEADWSAAVLSELEGPGFRVPKPVTASDGRWVVDGWAASRFVEGEHAGRSGGRWPETIAACEAFHEALVGVARPPFFDDRHDPWAIADRMAWGEMPLDVLPPFAKIAGTLIKLLTPIDLPSQMIHGDLTANVLFADGLPPCVIDFTPYWRPAGFAIGVIVADALTWAGADASILGLTDHIPEFPQLLLRAELRRVLELDQHHRRSRPGEVEQLVQHWPTARLVKAHLKRGSRFPGTPLNG